MVQTSSGLESQLYFDETFQVGLGLIPLITVRVLKYIQNDEKWNEKGGENAYQSVSGEYTQSFSLFKPLSVGRVKVRTPPFKLSSSRTLPLLNKAKRQLFLCMIRSCGWFKRYNFTLICFHCIHTFRETMKYNFFCCGFECKVRATNDLTSNSVIRS